MHIWRAFPYSRCTTDARQARYASTLESDDALFDTRESAMRWR